MIKIYIIKKNFYIIKIRRNKRYFLYFYFIKLVKIDKFIKIKII